MISPQVIIRCFPRRIRNKKKIPPITYMITPTGISMGSMIVRAAVSEISRISAPRSAEQGMR
jgi:hypothetical protein